MAMPPPMPPMPPMPPSPDMPPMPPASMDMPDMHMAFFWGRRAQVLFSNWPGDRGGAGMYVLCLLVVAALAALVEVLSAASRGLSSRRSRWGSGASGAALATAVHAVKVGVLYLVMLAAMSFNGGVFLAVVAGHAAGFLLARRGALASPATPDDDAPTTNGACAPSAVGTYLDLNEFSR